MAGIELYYNWRVDFYLYDNYTGGSSHHYYQSGKKFTSSPSYVVGVTIPSYTPTRTGYNFLGYTKNSDGSGTVYQVGDVYSMSFSGSQTKSLNLYAKWQIQTFTVSFNANGGSGAPGSQTKTYGVNLTLSSTRPTRANYVFQGWATSSTGAVVYQPGGSYTANAAVTLYAIWKVAAGILNTVTDTVIGQSGTASWTKINENHTYKLVISLSGADSVVVDNIAAGTASASFSIPNSWLDALPNSVTATATATLYSYNSGDLVGYTTKSFTVSVGVSVVPTISEFVAEANSSNLVVDGWGIAVQGYSYLTLSVDADPGDGASIASIAFAGSGISQNSQATSGDTTILTNAGTLTYTVIVTDSRGRTISDQIDVVCYEYSNPAVSTLEVVRCLNDGTASDTEGNYLKAFPVFSYSAVDGNNSLSVKKIEYREQGASSWTVGIAAAVTNMWSAVFGPADITKAFDVKLTIEDLLGNSFALQVSVQSVVGFALGLKNDRARFGGPVVKPGLQVDWPTEFNDIVDVTNRRCSATLSASGWYRVMNFDSTNAGYQQGATGAEIVFHITRRRTNAGEETHEVKMLCLYNDVRFVDEASSSYPGYQRIDKIRYTYDSDGAYVDIHVNNIAPAVCVDFEVYCEPDRHSMYTAASLESVADSPAGETVLATYSLSANTPDSGSGYQMLPDGTMLQWGEKSGISFSGTNMVSGSVQMTKAFASTDYVVVASPTTTGVNQYLFRLGVNPDTADTFNWTLGSGDSSNITITNRGFRWLSIGRWK